MFSFSINVILDSFLQGNFLTVTLVGSFNVSLVRLDLRNLIEHRLNFLRLYNHCYLYLKKKNISTINDTLLPFDKEKPIDRNHTRQISEESFSSKKCRHYYQHSVEELLIQSTRKCYERTSNL